MRLKEKKREDKLADHVLLKSAPFFEQVEAKQQKKKYMIIW